MTCQSVGVVADGSVNMAQTAERVRRSLKAHKHTSGRVKANRRSRFGIGGKRSCRTVGFIASWRSTCTRTTCRWVWGGQDESQPEKHFWMRKWWSNGGWDEKTGLIIIHSNWGRALSQVATLNNPRAHPTGFYYVGTLASNITDRGGNFEKDRKQLRFNPDPPPTGPVISAGLERLKNGYEDTNKTEDISL